MVISFRGSPFQQQRVRLFRNSGWLETDPELVLVRRVSRSQRPPDVPFGWAVDRTKHRLEVGPSWIILPIQLFWRFLPPLFEWAIRHDLLSCDEGELYSAARWFPTQPHFRQEAS